MNFEKLAPIRRRSNLAFAWVRLAATAMMFAIVIGPCGYNCATLSLCDSEALAHCERQSRDVAVRVVQRGCGATTRDALHVQVWRWSTPAPALEEDGAAVYECLEPSCPVDPECGDHVTTLRGTGGAFRQCESDTIAITCVSK